MLLIILREKKPIYKRLSGTWHACGKFDDDAKIKKSLKIRKKFIQLMNNPLFKEGGETTSSTWLEFE